MNWKERYKGIPITEFITNHYYKYTGNKQLTRWASDGKMDFVLDNATHLCTYGCRADARFNDDCVWDWSDGFENWREVFK